MLFKRKNIKKEFDQELIEAILDIKSSLTKDTDLFERSYSPQFDLEAQVLVKKRMYYSLLKEAKKRKVRII